MSKNRGKGGGNTISATAAGVRPERKPRVKRFSQKAKYADTSQNALTVSVRQVEENGSPAYRVSVSHQKAATGKRERGMVDIFPSKNAAVARYDEIVAMAVKAKWNVVATVARSSFDTLPLPA
jgi:hypothetical protein